MIVKGDVPVFGCELARALWGRGKCRTRRRRGRKRRKEERERQKSAKNDSIKEI